ncbi:DUF2236 domain-containing protein [Pelobium sp.]|nr:oxygenase MpaB family protein [Pelobium sp.]MDA9555050.1 DUF2236 domain-containing protein [Pelobium sp.]
MHLDLNHYRKIGDKPADDFVKLYFSDNQQKLRLDKALNNLNRNADWDAFLTIIPDAKWFDESFNEIGLVDQPIRKNALQFYHQKSAYILQLLGLLSLPYCYAAADGAQVLYQTERMYKDVGKRLEETAAFVVEMMNPKAFSKDGAGKVQLFKVRLMHAAARFYLQKANWDYQLGFPINQEDMAGTNLSFSLIVIRGLRRMGFSISDSEQINYIRYWSWIGAHLGLDSTLLPQNGKEAHDLESLIRERQFKTSEQGVKLTQSLLKCFYDLNDEKQIKNSEIAGFMRFLLGDKVADKLMLPSDNFSFSKKLLLKLKVATFA